MDRQPDVDREREALCDFLAMWHEDRAAGALFGLAHYLARFPDVEAAVAREFLRLVAPAEPEERPNAVGDGVAGAPRYERLGELARGGMGLVERVRDRRLGRDVAMKSALRRGAAAAARFEKEARLTGSLDHPGIVPVHDYGVDATGVPWFTMRLVGGRDLREIIRSVHAGDSTWTATAALGVLLRVCETVAYAHSRGVVHRDLKPSNVRVGQYGEVVVLDWGLARASHLPDLVDLRLNLERLSVSESHTGLSTMDGDVIGTPSTMSPEQAAGRLDEVGPRSDVYSVGAMLYELLAGVMPYAEGGVTASSKVVLERVLAGPPRALAELAPNAAPELVAVCDKAMQRDPARRFQDMREMAADVRAYLEGRVVRAYRTGVRAEARKWVARNKRLAIAIVAGLGVGVAALIVLARSEALERERLRLQADARAPLDLVARAATIATGRPEDAPALRAWADEAREVLAHIPGYRAELARLRSRALPWDRTAPAERAAATARAERLAGFDRLIAYYSAELDAVRAEGRLSEEGLTEAQVAERLVALRHDRARFDEVPVQRVEWSFERERDAERHTLIERLLSDVTPLIGGRDDDGLVAVLERRAAVLEGLADRTLLAAAAEWRAALASIADPAECPMYGGLQMEPQLGLVPLGRDPESGLWEFVHLASGEPPPAPPEELGIVLVLVPGGRVELGAQALDPERPGYDAEAQPSEWVMGADGPELLHAILAPFFIGKYEVNQAQWQRLVGRRPSHSRSDTEPSHVTSALHPVEQVDWSEARAGLSAVGLSLPTEAQWEYAARGGTSTPWWTGTARERALQRANLADQRYAAYRYERIRESPQVELCDDGFALHAPSGAFPPNPFGLHDTLGNVNEWVLDAGFIGYDKPHEVTIDTFERRLWGEGLRIRRGGSFAQRATQARSAARQFSGPEYRNVDTGLRAARAVERRAP